MLGKVIVQGTLTACVVIETIQFVYIAANAVRSTQPSRTVLAPCRLDGGGGLRLGVSILAKALPAESVEIGTSSPLRSCPAENGIVAVYASAHRKRSVSERRGSETQGVAVRWMADDPVRGA